MLYVVCCKLYVVVVVVVVVVAMVEAVLVLVLVRSGLVLADLQKGGAVYWCYIVRAVVLVVATVVVVVVMAVVVVVVAVAVVGFPFLVCCSLLMFLFFHSAAKVCDGKYSGTFTYRKDLQWCPRNFLHRYHIDFTSPIENNHAGNMGCDEVEENQLEKPNLISISAPLPDDLRPSLRKIAAKPCSHRYSGHALKVWSHPSSLSMDEWGKIEVLSDKRNISRELGRQKAKAPVPRALDTSV